MADKTLEMLFESVKDLTVGVDNLRQDILDGFRKMDERFTQVDERLVRLEQRFRNLEGDSDYAKIRLTNVERELNESKRSRS